ncbi:hypothetical protein [Frankia sp. R82]|uniref:ISAzo13-like element transposase-related protein n=1 Tax=Frankia sp. R82 TaxID=2950553 RepID=UPI0027E21A5F|nr:hypothetical protein [Frankia sp. R82]
MSWSHRSCALRATVCGRPVSRWKARSSEPDRDAQFRSLNGTAAEFLAAGDPAISVDTKKKELVGRFGQAGREWHRTGEPTQVNSHDFPQLADGQAIPYGVYDLAGNSAWVIVSLIASTTTTADLTVRCELDPADYPTKIAMTDQEKKAIPISRHDFHGGWNYAINPPVG